MDQSAPMTITKTRVFLLFAFATALYWVPALILPDQTVVAVGSVFLVLSCLVSFRLAPDIMDIVLRGRTDGMSWQAMVAKAGLYTLTTSYACARFWSLIVRANGFPDYLIHSPVGGYFSFLMGIGMLGIFYGFSSVGEIQPKLSPRGVILAAVATGIVIGIVISHIPIPD